MSEVDIPLHGAVSVLQYEQAIEGAAVGQDLRATLKGTLKQYPGCIHWHFKQGKKTGVLEITLWPQETRAWIAVHDNRKGVWVDGIIPLFLEDFQRLIHTTFTIA